MLPDLLVGRLPVNTITETQIVVDKIVRYETAPSPGGWNSNVVFVADTADAAGNFAAESDQLPRRSFQRHSSPARFTMRRRPRPLRRRVRPSSPVGTRARGWSCTMATRRCASGPPRAFFTATMSPHLHNASQLPVVLEMTCFTGLFHEPGGTTLDETLLRAAEGGAVAVWGATGLGVATGHQQLAQGFLAAVFQRSGRDHRRGDARWQAEIGGKRFERAGPGGHVHPAGRPSHEPEPDDRSVGRPGLFTSHPALAQKRIS